MRKFLASFFTALAQRRELAGATFRGIFLYYLRPRKTIVIIASAMRSGSTLLKELLAEAPEVSKLHETSLFLRTANRFAFYSEVYDLSEQKIIVLKKPFPLLYLDRPPRKRSRSIYPNLPKLSLKIIVLFRNPGDCIDSLERMFKIFPGRRNYKTEELEHYWNTCYENILQESRLYQNDLFCLSYEKLIHEPEPITKRLFDFIGSRQEEGTASYWRWGGDDASVKIRSLKVVRETSPQEPRLPTQGRQEEIHRHLLRMESLYCGPDNKVPTSGIPS